MDLMTILILIMVALFLRGGGFYWRRGARWR